MVRGVIFVRVQRPQKQQEAPVTDGRLASEAEAAASAAVSSALGVLSSKIEQLEQNLGLDPLAARLARAGLGPSSTSPSVSLVAAEQEVWATALKALASRLSAAVESTEATAASADSVRAPPEGI